MNKSADYEQCTKGLTLEKLNQVNQGKLTIDQATKTTDHWFVVKRKGSYKLLEGALRDAGDWKVEGPGANDVFSNRREAEEEFNDMVEREEED